MAVSKRAVRRHPPADHAVEAEDAVDITSNGDEDDAPKMRAALPPLKGGWGESQKQMDSTSQWAQTLRPGEKAQIIKFLQDTPYAAFRRHWVDITIVDEQNRANKTRRPFTCLKSWPFDAQGKPSKCPLCDIGDKAQATSCFNVAVCDEDGSLALKSWEVGARPFQVLKAYANDPKIAPLTKGFFLVSKTGRQGTAQNNITPIRATALEEDYDTPVPSQADLDSLTLYTIEVIDIPTVKQLREIAETLVDDYE
jgi:hypothetical protein